MPIKNVTKEVIVVEETHLTSIRTHILILYFLVTWPIIYLICFITRPSWLVGDDGYLANFTGPSGASTNSSNASLSNTILSDQGRENILWVSFLFALLVLLIVYLIMSYF